MCPDNPEVFKVKPSRHFFSAQNKGGHDIPLEDCERIIRDPSSTVEVQPDDRRIRYWNSLPNYPYPVRVVVSATASAAVSVKRVVTRFVDSGKR